MPPREAFNLGGDVGRLCCCVVGESSSVYSLQRPAWWFSASIVTSSGPSPSMYPWSDLDTRLQRGPGRVLSVNVTQDTGVVQTKLLITFARYMTVQEDLGRK